MTDILNVFTFKQITIYQKNNTGLFFFFNIIHTKLKVMLSKLWLQNNWSNFTE